MKEFLSLHGVTFEEKSLDDPRWLEELGEKYGAYSAPSVVVDERLVEGSLLDIAAAVGVEF